jgi:hypothetical protein
MLDEERPIGMMRHPSRLVPLVVVAVLGLGACGSGDDDSAAETPPTVAASSDDGLIAPRPIEMAGGGAAAGSANATAEAATADRSMAPDMIAPYQIMNFVAGDGLPALPTNDTGWVFQAGATVTADQVAQLAAALGVSGEPQRHDESGYIYWSVGPNDGTAPMVTVNEDAQLSWGYSSDWANQTVSASAGCAVSEPAIAADVATAGSGVAIATTAPKPVEPACTVETTPPPPGVPSGDEAEARTRELMTAVGLDPADFELETFADEWYASVNATEQLDGQFVGRSFSTGFGGEGVLQYAGGQLAEPAPVGPYPLVDVDTAIARLNDPSGFYMGGYGGGMALDTAVASREVAPAVGVDIAEAEVAPVPPETAQAAPPATDGSSTGGGSDGSTGGASAPPISEPVPVSIPVPQPVTVTLVDVQSDVWWTTDVDGTVWLLPAYRFIGDDGGWYTVPAVTDEFLVRVPVDSVPPVTDVAPLPPETAPAGTTPSDTAAPSDTVADVTPLESSVGKTFAEFSADAEALGLTARIVEQDGISLPVTMDYNPNRVNVSVTGEGDTATVTAIVNAG